MTKQSISSNECVGNTKLQAIHAMMARRDLSAQDKAVGWIIYSACADAGADGIPISDETFEQSLPLEYPETIRRSIQTLLGYRMVLRISRSLVSDSPHPSYSIRDQKHWAREFILNRTRQRQRIKHSVRDELIIKFGPRCAYCSAPFPVLSSGSYYFEVDHILPVRFGGQDTIHNYIPACSRCNASKGGLPLLLWIERGAGRQGRTE